MDIDRYMYTYIFNYNSVLQEKYEVLFEIVPSEIVQKILEFLPEEDLHCKDGNNYTTEEENDYSNDYDYDFQAEFSEDDSDIEINW